MHFQKSDHTVAQGAACAIVGQNYCTIRIEVNKTRILVDRPVLRQDHALERNLADRLRLPQGARLGLALHVDHHRRLQPLHHRLEALYAKKELGCHRHAGTSAGGVRLHRRIRCAEPQLLSVEI